MTFHRWTCNWPRTWPYVVFKKHHSQLSHFYWSSTAANEFARQTITPLPPAKSLDTLPELNLLVSRVGARRINYPIPQWVQHLAESENWMRLSALMSLAGYFETYMHAVVSLALTSDPGVLIASPQAADGLRLKKHGTLPDFKRHLENITSGTWQSRVGTYKRLFGSVPKTLDNAIAELTKMQKLRNGVGHSFGRFIDDSRSPLQMRPTELQRLNESRLLEWLKLVDDCVDAVEEHLRVTHIGAAEVLLKYHEWDKKFPLGHMNEEQAFRVLFPHDQGSPPPARYFLSAIKFYKAL
ncbi:hypothetical protein [Burkholderia sola]|uniref:hypothetical protein n=1 Tax=Burkholderia sola TaxID=2843302 RepID=UPI0023DD7B52|nr:hypothetical protein [Burkholderia sola]MDF3083234.1 hypothetical protein [Burkholderia sola]